MIRAPAVTLLLLLASSQAGAQAGAYQGDGMPAPMVVTTDTDAYCATLGRQISARGAHDGLTREVRELRAQGDALCASGHVRGGINRLRRALMVLREQRPTTAASAMDKAADLPPTVPGSPHG